MTVIIWMYAEYLNKIRLYVFDVTSKINCSIAKVNVGIWQHQDLEKLGKGGASRQPQEGGEAHEGHGALCKRYKDQIPSVP